MFLRDAQLVAVDFESTGAVAGYREQPWQLGVVPIMAGQLDWEAAQSFWIHVPPDRPFSPFAPGSWRLVRDDLAGARSLPDLWPVLRGRLAGVPLVAHNAATEKKFFRQAWPLHRLGPWVDTLTWSRQAFPDLPHHDLMRVLRAIGGERELEQRLPGRAAHDALYDAAASALVLAHLLQQPGWRDLELTDLRQGGSGEGAR
ncbi:MAG TPA: 3'-5' exonuclease [Kiritimatiellia bacterium]|nr:3'-5' exonuclease [Kiritimatiellia bacterium]HMO98930.1 3'-5' exonuclease [Kiritimatiellia bacterium]HMP95737.1 3'-5' exonuclease [Kiritimatiellia bacterium]